MAFVKHCYQRHDCRDDKIFEVIKMLDERVMKKNIPAFSYVSILSGLEEFHSSLITLSYLET